MTQTPQPLNLSPEFHAAMRNAIDSSAPFTKERNKALAKVKWRLVAADGRVAGLTHQAKEVLVDPSDKLALTFDGRDNEVYKTAWYTRALGVALTPTLI